MSPNDIKIISDNKNLTSENLVTSQIMVAEVQQSSVEVNTSVQTSILEDNNIILEFIELSPVNVSLHENDEQIPLLCNTGLENLSAAVQSSNQETERTSDSTDSDDSDVTLFDIVGDENTNVLNMNDNNGSPQQQNVEENHKIKSRKRQRYEQQWKRNEKKLKRNTGQAYTTTLHNKLIPQKKLKTPCNNSCRLKCYDVFTHEERERIFNSFWNIGNNNRQRQFISSNIDTVTPKYRYPKDNSTRSCNQAYFLVKNITKVRVCKQFFMATLDIGDSMIRTTLKKRDDNGIVDIDRRGKHENHKKLAPILIEAVKSHIDSIPRIESHYLRNQTTREFFEGDLNISILYRLYKENCIDKGSEYVKKCIYEKIFNTEYNIGFFQPKKDQCSTCETYKNSTQEEKQTLEAAHQKHIRDKDMSRIEKAKDILEATENVNKMVAIYDLQAVLPTPCGEVSSFYYKSKLATYNFTIFDPVPKQGYCYVWSENCAKRGANEIGTCVLKFLQEFCNGNSVTFYSDNCAGQNKNKFIAAMYLFAIGNLNIPSITHKFLITGHTQNEGDSMHSCIEREKKRVLKSGPIYVPSQWIPVIRLAKKNGRPYKVIEMDTDDILDFKTLSSDIGSNYSINTEKEKVRWTDIKVLNFNKNNPSSIFYKYNYDQENYLEIDVRGRRSIRNSATIILQKEYKEAPKISKNKKDGLIALCNSKAIKTPYHNFFNNLLTEN